MGKLIGAPSESRSRSCGEKRRHGSHDAAVSHASELTAKSRAGESWDPYVCPFCECWHVGRFGTAARNRLLARELESAVGVELGIRALVNQLEESTGSHADRIRRITARAASARRRALARENRNDM